MHTDFQVTTPGNRVYSDKENLNQNEKEKKKSAHRGYWSVWNTDCSVSSAIARTCRDISSGSCSPCLRIEDRRPIASRICFSQRRAPRGAFPRFPSNSVCRTSNVVRARPSSCWTTLWSELRDRTKLPASRRLLLFRQNRATNSVGNHFRSYLRLDLLSLFKTFESGAHANFQSRIRTGNCAAPFSSLPNVHRSPANRSTAIPPDFRRLFCQDFSKIRPGCLRRKLTATELDKQLLVFTVRRPDSFCSFVQSSRQGSLFQVRRLPKPRGPVPFHRLSRIQIWLVRQPGCAVKMARIYHRSVPFQLRYPRLFQLGNRAYSSHPFVFLPLSNRPTDYAKRFWPGKGRGSRHKAYLLFFSK